MNYFKIEIAKILGLVLISCFVLSTKNSAAQCSGICGPNLINNSSFELSTADCSTMNSEIFTDYSQVQDWLGTACLTCPGNGSTPDYYNSSCTGAAPTENCGLGTGSVGFFTSVDVGGAAGSNAREYVQTQLTTPLVPGQEYCATIQVKTSPASFAYVPTDGLGLWFTNAMVDIDVDNGGQQYLGPGSIVNATPQIANTPGNIIDTVCTTITGTFVATGTESWMVMGNFRPDNAIQTTATTCGGFFAFCFGYLIVDQVDVFPVCSSCDATIAAAGPFCFSDPSVNLTATDPGGTWSGPGITNSTNGTFDPSVAGTGVHNIIYDLACGDDDTISITVTATDDSTFSYANTSYCLSDADPSPTISGLTGGAFSIDNGGVIDSNSGIIDLSGSGNGNFTISYLTNGPCPTTGTFNITINSNADATISPTGPFCMGDPALNLNAVDPGGSWSGTGITNAAIGTFDPSSAGQGNHTIYYEILGACGDLDSISITINANDDSTFSYPNTTYCITDSDPSPNISGLSGGSFSINNGGIIDGNSGIIDLVASGNGNYTVSYLTNGLCPTTGTFDINIITSADATISPAGPFCANDPAANLNAADAGGNWSGPGITNSSLGTFDPSTAGPGNHMIYYEILGTCGDLDSVSITVNPIDDASFSYQQASYCISGTNPTPSISGLTGGTFSINGSGIINTSTGEIDLISSGLGNFIVTYLTNGSCPNSSTFNITIANSLDATINTAGPFCEDDPSSTLTAASSGGTWSGNGITDSNLGTFNPVTSGTGSHQIIYTISGICGDADTINIIVNPADNASISYASVIYCTTDTNPIPIITGTQGGVFSINNNGLINSTSGEINLTSSGPGSYIVSYITAGACPDTSTFNIDVNNGTSISINQAGPFCAGEGDVVLSATPAGGVWSGAGIVDSINGIFNADIAGLGSHSISYTTSGSCASSDSIIIDVYDQPNISLPASYTLNYGQSIMLNPVFTGSGNFSWSPDEQLDCSDCSNPTITPTSTITVCVELSNGVCSDTACTQLIVDYNCGEVVVPTAFSPNSGDVNSLECVLGSCVVSMNFKIYDRWGELVFESVDPNSCWDGTHVRNGKEMSTGVYVYQLEADLIDGSSVSKKGNITLLR